MYVKFRLVEDSDPVISKVGGGEAVKKNGKAGGCHLGQGSLVAFRQEGRARSGPDFANQVTQIPIFG